MATVIGSISKVMRYPVKSLLGEALNECAITLYGLDRDRTHALIDAETGKIASAKQPNLWRDLLLLSSRLDSPATGIVISDGNGNIFKDTESDIDAKLTELIGRQVKLTDVRPGGAELNRARPDEVMSDGVNATVSQDLLVIAAAAPGGGFFDFAPIHLITSASLDAASATAPQASITAERYRPNLVIETLSSEPFAENGWIGRRVKIGRSIELELLAPTPRCAVPMLAHGDLPRSPEAVGAVNKLNRVEFPMLGPGTFPCLGAYATVITSGLVQCGDQVVLQ